MVVDSMIVGTVPVHDSRRLPDQVLLDQQRKDNVMLCWLSLPPFFLSLGPFSWDSGISVHVVLIILNSLSESVLKTSSQIQSVELSKMAQLCLSFSFNYLFIVLRYGFSV